MRALTTVDLVDIWEQGWARGPTERALLLLGRTFPYTSTEELEAMPLGVRDDQLLQLRQRLFGATLESVVRCPRCGESLEIKVDAHELQADLKVSTTTEADTIEADSTTIGDADTRSADLQVGLGDADTRSADLQVGLGDADTRSADLQVGLGDADTRSADLQVGPRENSGMEWTAGDLSVRFRVPTSRDFLDLEAFSDPDEVRRRLIERCVLDAHRGTERIQALQLREEETVALGEQIAQADPHGELMLNAECPSCGHRWESLLDIASFLWQEIDIHVRRLLTDVHTLASAYSWSERDILSMSALRRQMYLEELLAR